MAQSSVQRASLLGGRKPAGCSTCLLAKRDPLNTNPGNAEEPPALAQPCPCCGGHMIIIERFERGSTPGYRPSALTPTIRIDTS
jgi:hypothetical protein